MNSRLKELKVMWSSFLLLEAAAMEPQCGPSRTGAANGLKTAHNRDLIDDGLDCQKDAGLLIQRKRFARSRNTGRIEDASGRRVETGLGFLDWPSAERRREAAQWCIYNVSDPDGGQVRSPV
jgi:hypothetical protein